MSTARGNHEFGDRSLGGKNGNGGCYDRLESGMIPDDLGISNPTDGRLHLIASYIQLLRESYREAS